MRVGLSMPMIVKKFERHVCNSRYDIGKGTLGLTTDSTSMGT